MALHLTRLKARWIALAVGERRRFFPIANDRDAVPAKRCERGRSNFGAPTTRRCLRRTQRHFPIMEQRAERFESMGKAARAKSLRSTFPRRVAASMGQRNTCLKFIGRSLESQCLSWSLIMGRDYGKR